MPGARKRRNRIGREYILVGVSKAIAVFQQFQLFTSGFQLNVAYSICFVIIMELVRLL
mgnify:CR=1 FL=1